MARARISLVALVGLIGSTLVGFATLAPPASAVQTAQPSVVSAVPATNTPDVNDGTVFAIGQVGGVTYLGGDFTSVSAHGSTTATTHNNIVAFNASTGAVDNTSFLPTVNGEIDSIIPGPAAGQVYIAGSFSTVDGVAMHLALLNTSNGSLVSTWKPSAMNGSVDKVVLRNNILFAAGLFKTVGGVSHQGLASLDPTTGKVTTYVQLAFTGHHNFGVRCTSAGGNCVSGTVGVKSIDVDPTGTRLVAVGNFTCIAASCTGTSDPNYRDQVAMISLGASSATLTSNWATAAYTAQCFSGAFDSYIRDVQFSPDGSYFVIAATGGSGTNDDGTNSSCDTAARFETGGIGTDVRPTWIDYTGQDSFWSISITGSVVYAGGHERWVNNSLGHDNPGQGAVPRPGIAAFDPVNGMPLSWNPGRNPRGAGAYALLATADGLYVGSDTDYIGNHKFLHKKVAFFPLAGGETLPSNTTPTLPGKVYTAGGFPTPGSSNVLYRLNEGGPTIVANDNGPDWQGDDSGDQSFRNSGSNTAGYDPVANVDGTVPASTPSGIFDSERWDPGSKNDGGEMHFAFPVPAGEKVDVRLYLANRCTCTSGVGQRVFDVAVDKTPFLSNFDIVQAAGDQTGTMRSDTVTSDGEVDIDFTHEVENALINGIEIVKDTTPAPTFPAPIYRVNAGGNTIAATDAPADWLADDQNTTNGDPTNPNAPANGTAFRLGGNTESWDDPWLGTVGPTVPASTPTNVFSTAKWGQEQYQFPVDPGTPTTVKLFFANNYPGTSAEGQRQFNVTIDGQQVLTNFDIVADAKGDRTGEMQSFPVTVPASGEITIQFSLGLADNPLVNGIQIDQTGTTQVQPSDPNRISNRHVADNGDGTVTVGTEANLAGTGIAWGTIRGAFMVNGELVYGKSDGKLYERTYNGTTFGAEVALDPYDDPVWDDVQTGSGQTYQGTAPTFFGSELSSVTSMFYTNGRMYYTVKGRPQMFWRWFEPESGVVGSDEFTTSGTDTNDYSNVAGGFLSGHTFYFADRDSGQLQAAPWSGTAVTGAPTQLATGQSDWASRAIFMVADATHPNQAPVASFTSSCSTANKTCTFDASSSKDPDGSITDFGWTFGDGLGEHHPDSALVTHNYGAAGPQTVTLTVTDNDGATGTKTSQVSVGASTPVPTFKGAVSTCSSGTATCGKSATTNVPVPSGATAGDTLLMFVSWSQPATAVAATVPAAWHLVGTDTSGTLESDVYSRAATSTDPGSTVPVTFGAAVRNAVTLGDYTGADPGIEASAKAADTTTASHTTPTVAVTVPGSLAVSYWADKSGTTTGWTLPADVTGRSTFIDTGTSFDTSVLADSGSTVGTGNYGAKTATTNKPSGKGAEWTVILAPAGATPNQKPTAAYTSSCTGLTCSFNGTSSTDPEGPIASYAWDFADGVGSTSTSATPSHQFSAPGTYQVKLTVTDSQGATGVLTKPITVSAAGAAISFVGGATFDGNGTVAKVTVPAATNTGDTLLLFESHASTGTSTAPAGWTLVGSTSKTNLVTNVYRKQAAAGDASSSVTVTYPATVKASLVVADYRNTAASPIETSVSSVSTTVHSTPALTGLTAGTLVVSYWTDKSTTNSAWTTPAGVTKRADVYGTAAGADSALLADSNGPVTGNYPSQTATNNAPSGSSAQWSIALSSAG
jgi:PKD repeat protein